MRTFILFFPLVITACSGNNERQKKPNVTSSPKESIQFRYVAEQYLLIQSTKIHIKMASVEIGFPEKQDWIIITTPKQKLSYLIKDRSHAFALVQNLSSEQLNLLQKEPPHKAATEIDLNIHSLAEKYQILNTLQLSRCRTATAWNDLVEYARSERPTIYFNASFALQTSWALAWDMNSQIFKGIVDTYYELESTSVKDVELLLTPNRDIYSKNRTLLEDSQFVSFSSFHEGCDFGYDPNADLDTNRDFLPRYDKSIDDIQSRLLRIDFNRAAGSTSSAIWIPPVIAEDDISYAQELKLF